MSLRKLATRRNQKYMFEANFVVFFHIHEQSADINQGVDRSSLKSKEQVTKE
jgi:S-adenosylmethionine synthetase